MAKERPKNFRKEPSEFDNRVVSIRRVSKATKGGRNMSFSALVVVGNKKGKIGVGSGKATEVPAAIEKAIVAAKRNLITIPLVGTSIPHEALGKFGKASVLLMPAKEGTGVIAGGASRAVIELTGIKDILSKSYGARNKINSVKATLEGLKSLRTKEQVAALRGKKPEEI